MKKIFLFLIVIAFVIISCIPPTSPSQNGNTQDSLPSSSEKKLPKIGLDPGHGWSDSRTGAEKNGIAEKDLNFEVAMRTKWALEELGYEVVMTRNGDNFDKPLRQAAVVMNNANVDLVVSIHANSFDDTSTGTEACYTVGKSTDEQSRKLAALLAESQSKALSIRNRGIFPEDSKSVCGKENGRLYIHDMDAPAALLELGFISNPIEAELLLNQQDAIANAITKAILEYFGIIEPGAHAASQDNREELSVTTSVATFPSVLSPADTTTIEYSELPGLHFSGKGPKEWSIQKEPGMVIAHVRTKGCWYFVLSGSGQGYETVPISTLDGNFDTTYQYLFTSSLYRNPNIQPSSDWNGSATIDAPYIDGNDNFISNPNLEKLRMEEVTQDCFWEVDLVPLSSARKVFPGQIISGTYDEVLAVQGTITSIELLWGNNEKELKILQAFSGWSALTDNLEGVCLWCLDEDEDYYIENLPPGIKFISIWSQGYWEIIVE